MNAKFTDRIKKFLSLDNDYLDDEYGELDEYETREPERSQPAVRASRANRDLSRTPTRVVDIHTTAKLQVVLKKPEHFDEATAIADELIEKRTVVLNLEATEKGEAGKLLCFLSGVAYANGGKLKKIANNTYIITPYNVDVMGDLLDELESNGMFFV
ncbi:MAG: cell division protein SepF [Clostridia bacterium]|nr:cell division protein SepF [Clostridia bacterium]MBR0508798.1 cell division protein SepF [Clostridia bacterium]